MTLKYRPEIDGLRAVAVLPVIAFHAGFSLMSGGFIGVDVFFVISGYLIATIIFERMQTGAFSLLDFYEARARRILPALFFVMLACIPFAWLLMNPVQWREFSESMVWTSFFSSNIFFWLNSDYFASASEFKPLIHSWSLAVEEQYYLFFPVIILAGWRFGKTLLSGLLITLALASFLLCCWLATRSPDANFFLTPPRIWELLAGVGCAAILLYRKDWVNMTPQILAQALSAAGLAMIAFGVVRFDQSTPFPSAWALFPVLGTALIILFANGQSLIGRLLSVRPLVWIGLISYSAYLWHQPIFAFARIHFAEQPSAMIMLGLAALSLLLAFISWRWVEQPFRKQKTSGKVLGGRKWLKNRDGVFTFALAGILGFSALGIVQANQISSVKGQELAKDLELKLQTLGHGRGKLIRLNQCHFRDGKDWQEKWDCYAGSGPDKSLEKTSIAIVGDSHGADKAMMLRTLGLSPTQLGIGGCSFSPNDKRKDCQKFIDFAFEKIARRSDITEIWLVNRIGNQEAELDYLKGAIEYWSKAEKPLVYFASMPEYKNYREKLYKSAPELPILNIDLTSYDRSITPDLTTYLKAQNVLIVDTLKFLCACS